MQRLLALGPAVVTRSAGAPLALVLAPRRGFTREHPTRAGWPERIGTFGLVLVPTRELAVQSLEALQGLTRPFPWLVTGSVMGGESRKSEKARLERGGGGMSERMTSQ